jgi:Protein of unknown function (DUF2852)
MDVVAKLDERGKGAWILAMIAGFVLFWPVGLAILAYMIWSGRMGCMQYEWNGQGRQDWRAMREDWRAQKRQWREEMRGRWHQHRQAAQPSGNAAFDDYKAETLKRLEEEQAEFHAFLDNLRKSRDKAEFDQFMDARRAGAPGETGPETGDGPQQA